MKKSMIEIQDICKVYSGKNQESIALNHISLEFEEKGFVFINGVSGSGKTTLMNMISGLDSPTSGKILYCNRELNDKDEQAWCTYRNTEVGIVFQSYNLIEDISVKENLMIPLKIQDIDTKEYADRIESTLGYVGLDGYENRKICELSGGQRQRVAIARAIIKKPKVLLADEATGNLDQENTENILNLFNKISKNCLVILISHDAISAEKYGDRLITLADGEVIRDVDNKKLKKLYEEPYEIVLSGIQRNVRGAFKTINIKKELENFIQESKSVSIQLSIEKKEKDEVKESYHIWQSEEKAEKSLGFRNILNNVFSNLKKKKVKIILMIIVITLINSLFFMVHLVAGNRYDESIVNYEKATKDDFVKVKLDDGEDVEQQGGKLLYQQLQEMVGDNIVKKYGSCSIETSAEISIDSVDLYIDENHTISEFDIEGNVPKEKNEIVISSDLSKELSIGDQITVDDADYQIVGVSSCQMPAENSYVITTFNPVYDALCKEKNCNLQGIDISQSVDKSTYAASIERLGNIEYLEQTEFCILWGGIPQSANEILISSEMEESIRDENDGKLLEEIRLPDLYHGKMTQNYERIVNLSDYTGRTVKIVGVYDETELEEDYGSIVVTDKVYNSVLRDYAEYIPYDGFFIPLSQNPEETIKKIKNHDIVIDNPICDQLYGYGDISKRLQLLWIGIYAVLLILISITLITYLTNNVKGEKKKIGIYRSIGVNNRDISNMYLLENSIIYGIALILSIILTCILKNVINHKIDNMIRVTQFVCFSIPFVEWILLGCGLFLISGVITYLPIRRLLKNKSIILINEASIS